jgi:hypothetical protein
MTPETEDLPLADEPSEEPTETPFVTMPGLAPGSRWEWQPQGKP